MGLQRSLDEAAVSISSLGKEEIKQHIKNFKSRFKLDFTDEYLNTLSTDRLRHILLAALLVNTGSPQS